jgi:hypothetical protein
MLAYDQGLEQGPSKDFNQINYNPQFIIDTALETSAYGFE